LSEAPDRANPTRDCYFVPGFLEDLRYWVEVDQRVAKRVLDLVEAVRRDPFRGIGKPEPLRGVLGGWSRRITLEHRLRYLVEDRRITFLQARYHY